MSEEIARVEFGKEIISGQSPFVCVKTGYGSSTDLQASDNGFQSSSFPLSVEMFDALRELVNDHRVVEHYESLRQTKYEHNCVGEPVKAYSDPECRTLRNDQLNKEHEL